MRDYPREVGSLAPRRRFIGGCYPDFRRLIAEVGNVQVARRLSHRPLAATVVAGGRSGIGVSRELLDRREVAYGVQEVPDEGLPEIVGGDLLYLGLPVAPLDHLVDRLVRK